MQITLNQDEIHEAVENYVRSQITIAPNQTISIDFTAGRGANGLSATLDIRTGPAKTNKPVYRSADNDNVPTATASRGISSTPENREEPEVEKEQPEKDAPESSEEAPEAPEKAEKVNPFKKASKEAESSSDEAAKDPEDEEQPVAASKSIFSKKAG